MTSPSHKIALFIDGANLYATAKTLGFDIDYKRLLLEFQNRGTLVRAFYYTAIIEDQEYSSIRPLIDWLDYNGYHVVTKATKEFIDARGRRNEHVTVVSTISSQPPMIADELRRQADVFTDLVQLQSKLGRDPGERTTPREPRERQHTPQFLQRSASTIAPRANEEEYDD